MAELLCVCSMSEAGQTPIKPIGFQWHKYEAWRHHPYLKFDKRNPAPGLRIGLGAFVLYKAFEYFTTPAGHDQHHH
jgi:hypothetical protein